jgi:hypothetical protein
MREDRREDAEDDGPERLFRLLRDRPAPELDAESAWARLQGALNERPDGQTITAGHSRARWWTRPVPQWAFAAAAVAVVAAGLWVLASDQAGISTDGIASRETPEAASIETPAEALSGSDLVLLADAMPTASDQPSPDRVGDSGLVGSGPSYALDVRVIRGFDGPRPADAMPMTTAGAGGADPLADIAAMLTAVMGPPGHALVGSWRGVVEDGAGSSAVSERFELRYVAERVGSGLRLQSVQLIGEGQPWIADEIVLEPGRSYLFGAGRAATDGSATDVVLAIRLRELADEPAAALDQ